MLKDYLQVTKPGIIYGNLVSVAGGFLLASQGKVDWLLFLSTLLGVALVIASGCVFNNYIDQDIDARMTRTRNRAFVVGRISGPAGLAYGTVLGLGGLAVLYWLTNVLAFIFALVGFVVYVGVYSLCTKRRWSSSTIFGSFSGAAPPVIGYLAVRGQLDAGAWLLLLIFCLWQVPHSYAIGIFRHADYKIAGVPVLPVKLGVEAARRHIVGFIVLFLLSVFALPLAGYVGWLYTVVVGGISFYWLWVGLQGWRTKDINAWARRVFWISIIIVVVLCVALAVDYQVR